MHSFNSTSPLHHSFTRTNEPRITIAIHHNHPSIHQPCIARYHSVWHSYMHASRCHGSHTMECKVCMHTACQPPPFRETYIYTCMHACTEMRTTRMMIMMVMMPLPSSSHPLNLLMSVFGGDEEEGGDGGGSSIRCRCSS